MDNNDSEYEYEYDEDETETFYLNLELTSCNGLIRPPRKRSSSSNTMDDSAFAGTATASHESPVGIESELPSNHDPELQSQVQIMDLHSSNPIISYYNQIFSCSWADMLGTELMFSYPDESSAEFPPLHRHGDDYELIAANRVRILGRKANLISSSGDIAIGQSSSATIQTPRHTAYTNQARFLERLACAKQARGETDAVRTVFPQKKNQNIDGKLEAWAKTGAAVAEVGRLKQLISKGDTEALEALERLYSQSSETASQDAPNE
ncbi:hypothetical protein FQN57_002719 [Myotisia sp. PD_48]|nr:hypothetical protein FQN57_002719 [Myotisia sp. PD_48]